MKLLDALKERKIRNQIADRAIEAFREIDGVADNQDREGKFKSKFTTKIDALLENYGR